jgi:ketosteroid isomerase-like protein
MPDKQDSDLVRAMFAAFMAGDRAVAEALLADDFTFTSPYDHAIDRTAYFDRCWPNSDRLASQVIERIFVEGNEAFVLYRCDTVDGRTFRNTEFFTFAGDRIASIDVFFGASYRDGVLVPEG